MVILSRAPDRICWQLSQPSPNTFSLSEILVSYDDIYDFELADTDADGDLDIVASVDYPTRIVWFENTGDPDALFREEELILQTFFIDNIQLEDINKDSIPDLSMSGRVQSSDSTNFHIMLGEGDGSFAPPSGTTYRLQLGLFEPPPFFFITRKVMTVLYIYMPTGK
ncbi:MAG: VCBS repeat-containing protein [Lewinellaceae bacterium]|nr:VCBS repeat-containing protein [Lewinellaceae bacterium]